MHRESLDESVVFEEMEVKKEVFAKLDAVMKPGALLLTNSSALPGVDLGDLDLDAARRGSPERDLLEVGVAVGEAADDGRAVVEAEAAERRAVLGRAVDVGRAEAAVLEQRAADAHELVAVGVRVEVVEPVSYNFV